jgi:peroxiredoxin
MLTDCFLARRRQNRAFSRRLAESDMMKFVGMALAAEYSGGRTRRRSLSEPRKSSIPGGLMAVTVGQSAPDFTLKDQNQKEVKLSEFAGKRNVVLMFYPFDFSPVCTNEHACMVTDWKQFDKLDAQVLGLSVDSVWTHKAFAEKMGISYPLLADFQPRGAVGDKYGVFLPDKGMTGRAIAIIDKGGKIAWFKNYDLPALPDIQEVRQALAAVK